MAKNSRFEVLRVVAGTKDFQRLLDLACPRERRACEHPHDALLPCGRLPIFTLDLNAQVAQLLERRFPCVIPSRTDIARERSNALECEVLGVGWDERRCRSGGPEGDLGAGFVDECRGVVWRGGVREGEIDKGLVCACEKDIRTNESVREEKTRGTDRDGIAA